MFSSTASFTVTPEEAKQIARIVERAIKLAAKYGLPPIDPLSQMMDLAACHANGCPLDLAKLEAARDADFGHDVFGITAHIDRRTGELGDCFLPRCAAPETPAPPLT